MRREEPYRIGDCRLVKRLEELLAAKTSLEIEVTAALHEYGKRRVALARAGKPLAGPLAEPLAIDQHARDSIARREQLARDHHEADERALRDGRTRALLSG